MKFAIAGAEASALMPATGVRIAELEVTAPSVRVGTTGFDKLANVRFVKIVLLTGMSVL